MLSKLYRLTEPTLAIVAADYKEVAVTIPSGSMLKLVDSLDSEKVGVEWDGTPAKMFLVDFRERTEMVVSLGRADA